MSQVVDKSEKQHREGWVKRDRLHTATPFIGMRNVTSSERYQDTDASLRRDIESQSKHTLLMCKIYLIFLHCNYFNVNVALIC